MALVLHWSYEQGTEIILAHGGVAATHTQILQEIWQLLQSSYKSSLLLKIDAESLIHWVEFVSKLRAGHMIIT